jgi:hypothetical protein
MLAKQYSGYRTAGLPIRVTTLPRSDGLSQSRPKPTTRAESAGAGTPSPIGSQNPRAYNGIQNRSRS